MLTLSALMFGAFGASVARHHRLQPEWCGFVIGIWIGIVLALAVAGKLDDSLEGEAGLESGSAH
jgi:hypothetical protein